LVLVFVHSTYDVCVIVKIMVITLSVISYSMLTFSHQCTLEIDIL